MIELFLPVLLGALAAAVTASLVFPLVNRIAMAVRAVDYPGGRRLQREAIPRMGGIAIAAGIAVGAFLPSLMIWQRWVERATSVQSSFLFIGTALVFVIGVADDIVGLSCIQRFLVQVMAAAGVVYGGWSFGLLYVPLWGEVGLGLWGGLVTVVWIVGVTNAINLLDGLDGLAGGVAAIIATSLLIFAWIQENALTVVLMSAIVGACLGFLRYNWAPAKIYMGDSGSLTLGFLLAVMSLRASMKGAAAVAILVALCANVPGGSKPYPPPVGPDRAGAQKNCSGDLLRCCLLLRHGAGGGGESQRGTWHCYGSGRGIGGFAHAEFGSPTGGATCLSSTAAAGSPRFYSTGTMTGGTEKSEGTESLHEEWD
ncbi:MAG: hypothetical protein DMG17_33525 [Acidobacteria bacterium]|nr:MAG: hypothetical protein DMG17_33525 [Acidobacteriota bacterium]